MESIKEHVKIATQMYDKKLSMENVKKFTINDLLNCCKNIETTQIPKKIYEESDIIQSEMIRELNTIEYLIELYNAGIDLSQIENLVGIIQNNEEKLVNYEIDKIIKVLQYSGLDSNTRYAYLKYFINNIKSNIGKKTVIGNLEYFFSQDSTKLHDLTIDEIRLFTSPFLSDYNLIPRNNIKRVYELLVQNSELKKFILFLYLNNLKIPLNIELYEKFNKDIKAISGYIYSIVKMIDNETMYRLLLRWIENKCNIYDLKFIKDNIGKVEKSMLEKIVCNRSGYINFIFGNKLSNTMVENINCNMESLIIYAISNNKKGFLKLIEQNKETFLKIPSTSILYNEEFYSKYVNINALNSKDLVTLQFMKYTKNYINILKDGIYTFNEIKTLYDVSNENYYKIYNYLLDLKVDERILRIKQIKNQSSIISKLSDDEIYNLAEKLKVKSLYNWIEQDFNNIKEIMPNDAVDILIHYNDVNRFIPQIKERDELLYVLRNKDVLKEYYSLQEIQDNIEDIDLCWKQLVDILELTPDFINKNKKNIKHFLLKNGAEIALTYYKKCYDESKRKSYKLIIKSELMGEFKKLKYHTNDLNKEISYELEEYQIDEWTKNNMKICEDKIEVSEYDDFYHTMILGEKPMRTCLSYKDGMYNRCLLACFDSNKKILYAKIGGEIVARAMVRLTKGTYKNVTESQSLEFVDLENISNTEEKVNEKLTIFLEKAYVSGISDILKQKIEKMFIKVLEDKASKMNALLVLSNYYSNLVNENYVTTRYYMYISKSKAGSQYLDSLNGQASISDEGQYKANNFLIWKSKDIKKSIFEENIF